MKPLLSGLGVTAALLAPLAAGLLTGACSTTPANGTLKPVDVDCGERMQSCDGLCVAIDSDARNCGACGKKCGTGLACVKGACSLTCIGGLDKCGDACVDVHNDAKNCSACGKACVAPSNATALCSAGMCTSVCQMGFDDCNAKPDDGCEANLSSDPLHCGACPTKCGTPAHGKAVCTAGKCTIASCDMGFDDCDKDPTNGCEADLNGSAANCGKCGTMCGMTQVCGGGTCIDSVPSCKALKASNPNAGDGTYLIDPDGPQGPIVPFKAFCDMTVNGGGWTQCVSFKNTIGEDIDCNNNQKWFHPCVDFTQWSGKEVMVQLRDQTNNVVYSGYGTRPNPWTYTNLTSPGDISSQYDRGSQHPNLVMLNTGHRLTISGFDANNSGWGGSWGNGYTIVVATQPCYACAVVLAAMGFKSTAPSTPCQPRYFQQMSAAHELMYSANGGVSTNGDAPLQPQQAFLGEMRFFVR